MASNTAPPAQAVIVRDGNAEQLELPKRCTEPARDAWSPSAAPGRSTRVKGRACATSSSRSAGSFLKHVFADFVAMEDVVRASGLDWTIVRRPSLTDKPGTGDYRTRRDLNLRRNLAVSRADVAHLILAVSGDSETYGHAIYIAS
jgi:NAD(P)H-binding